SDWDMPDWDMPDGNVPDGDVSDGSAEAGPRLSSQARIPAGKRGSAMADKADGHASEAAQAAGAEDEVSRNTKTQTEAASYTTTDHEVIKAWAQARGGRPASVEGTENGSDAGILRLEFPEGPQGDSSELDSVEWDAFFETFDQRNLAFVYQEKTSGGEVSRFNKFVSRQD